MGKSKSDVGPKLAYLGVLCVCHSSANGMQLIATPTPSKSKRMSDTARRFLHEHMISPARWTIQSGNYASPEPVLSVSSPARSFGANTERFAPKDTPAKLSPPEILGLKWRGGVIAKLSPRIPRSGIAPPDFAIYTDAAAKPTE